MLNRFDLKEYRLLAGLSLRDVARYCNISAQLIGQIENGERNITESNYEEIKTGINKAKQAIANGTFAEDKKPVEPEKKPAEDTPVEEPEKPTPKKSSAKR